MRMEHRFCIVHYFYRTGYKYFFAVSNLVDEYVLCIRNKLVVSKCVTIQLLKVLLRAFTVDQQT